jgi:cytochrome oxidase Cu insertion factor (SCO1/SenC/PrrC family)
MVQRLALLTLLAAFLACSDPRAQADAKETSAQEAKLGKPAPDFSLPDTDGKTVSLKDFAGKTVVLEWFNPECPFVKSAHGKGPLHTMAKERASDKLVWLSINSNAPGKQGHGAEQNRAAKAVFGMDNRVLLDESGRVGRSYGAAKTPHLFIVNDKGVLVYRGGLDNAPMGVVDDTRPKAKDTPPGTLVSYVANALDALAAHKAIPLDDTPAYGCSVKYGD